MKVNNQNAAKANQSYKQAKVLFSHYIAVMIDLEDLLNSVGSPNRSLTDGDREQAKHLNKLLEKVREEFVVYLDTL